MWTSVSLWEVSPQKTGTDAELELKVGEVPRSERLLPTRRPRDFMGQVTFQLEDGGLRG